MENNENGGQGLMITASKTLELGSKLGHVDPTLDRAHQGHTCLRTSDHSYPFGTLPFSLPILKGDFPPQMEPKIGTARYCTMKAMYRGRDEERKREKDLEQVTTLKPDNKQIADMKLPEINLNVGLAEPITNKLPSPDLSRDYVNNFKRILKQRGVNMEELFAQNRNKAERAIILQQRREKMRELQKMREVRQRKRRQRSLDNDGYLPMTLADPFPDMTPRSNEEEFIITTERSRTQYDDESVALLTDRTEQSDLEKRMAEIMQEHQEIPGQNYRKCKPYRKLGHVVSSNRLSQLLDSTNPLKMDNFYNYYM